MPYNDTDLRILVTFSEEMVFGFIEERYEFMCFDNTFLHDYIIFSVMSAEL